MPRLACAALVLMAAAVFSSRADAAEVKLLSSLNMMPVFATLSPQFERATKNKLSVKFGESVPVRNRILAGEEADAVIDLKSLFDELDAKGKILSGTAVAFTRATISVIVGRGAAKPNIDSGEALKRLLLTAKSVTYANPVGGGAAGIVLAGLLQRLGIADVINAKAILVKNGREVVATVAKGGAEVGITQTSIARSSADITYVGTLPKDALDDKFWNIGTYVAGVVSGAKEPKAAHALVQFLSSPAAISALRAKGMEPLAAR